jgi:hypothetical protein
MSRRFQYILKAYFAFGVLFALMGAAMLCGLDYLAVLVCGLIGLSLAKLFLGDQP